MILGLLASFSSVAGLMSYDFDCFMVRIRNHSVQLGKGLGKGQVCSILLLNLAARLPEMKWTINGVSLPGFLGVRVWIILGHMDRTTDRLIDVVGNSYVHPAKKQSILLLIGLVAYGVIASLD